MTAALTTALAAITDSLAAAGITIADSELETLLVRADAAKPRSRQSLAAYLAEQDDPWTTPNPYCPYVFARVAYLLAQSGYPVTPVPCTQCGHVTPKLDRVIDGARCCGWCASRHTRHICDRCGQLRYRVAATKTGGICSRCYQNDPERQETCGMCGRSHIPSTRTAEGLALCGNCARPKYVCAGCGRTDHAKKLTDAGPLCQRCYQAPVRACGKCGAIGRIAVRAQHGARDLCFRCAQAPHEHCAICTHHRPVHTRWPLGPVCLPCYRRTIAHPQTCESCGDTKVLVALDATGARVCGPCSGAAIDYACHNCGHSGPQHYAGMCLRCSVAQATRELITVDGSIRPELEQLPAVLADRGQPASTLRWLSKPATEAVLHTLASDPEPLTHATLDQCPPTNTRHWARAMLVEANILPRRDEPIERFETWVTELTAGLPAHQATLIGPYARWAVLRAARRRARRRGYTDGAANSGRERIRTAVRLLNHLDQQHIQTSDLTQAMIDGWTAGNAERSSNITGFIHWLAQRGVTASDLSVARLRRALPSEIACEDAHHARIDRLLHGDGGEELLTRVAGLLVLLYGARLTQIQRLTTGDITTSAGSTQIKLARHPLQLPEPVGALVNELADAARNNWRARAHTGQHYLFPGGQPGRPIHTATLSRKLTDADIPERLSRNRALLALANDIPAAVLATQLGLHATTTAGWAKFAQRDWGVYTAIRQGSLSQQTEGAHV
ncbi:hypothetical protein [Mycobacterium palustre]|uniref:Uncharacterized protein n=1 Tax=Mycobacterium palustre TaxID=153971 RepID=A0A1X1ZV57_9MYCO|nr:hypothetical protein [Mycobacterium palustre]MCV7101748.1 hypothetical protein [Mycobacterium palustre]ORW27791.1 hypothetical protein AWC19_02735 [Mycobacterium palustre]